MMEIDLDAATLLQKLSTTFDTYIYPAHEVEESRKHQFHDDAASGVRKPPQLGDDLRDEYLQAVRANVAAKRRYEEAASSASQTRSTDQSARPASDKATLLDHHLEFLRLKERNAQLMAMNDEVNTIKISSGPALVQLGSTATESEAATFSSTNGQGTLAKSIIRSIQALEMAVVQAKHEAMQQETLLDRAISGNQEFGNITAERYLIAMSAARKELTTWLQEVLDRCQDGTDVLNDEGADDSLETEEDLDKRVSTQYERYIDARKKLLSTVANLRAPLPEKESRDIEGGNEAMEAAFTTQGTNLTNMIEKRLLPSMQQQRMSSSHLVFVDKQLQKESATTINMLERLSDESQLLQAFPILVRSGRFMHTASTFGNKQQQEATAGMDDKVSKRLDSWIFAAEAAEVASSGAIEKHLKQGTEAVDEVWRGLAEIQLLQEGRI
ncbi:uncharacterized protein Z519_12415 [Cladophialophora bantiana CBS 173.52]|uniref:Uncharacterized protein n=1 Tax=Cladophialophora bantiana (strain ATCC 10958 / CBS 173.52 / CDC B-1940 / NIH 8579) TaxID=1442370 RepID=A0A0D2H7W7_CLAB1|nr:uncharacterized protein Z519_12415 [Cladophialophora bantiana CBS 173.52]KIW86950.1 hypothetical protein Z519_12415 [Cladophialophora bantiana CBS 173.52]